MRKSSSVLVETFDQINCTTPPRTNVINTAAGNNIPIPIADGEGTFSQNFSTKSVNKIPTAIPTKSPIKHPGGNASNPFVSNSAKPAHFTLIGDESPSGPIPNLFRRTGYTSAVASEPTGAAMSCAIVRFRLLDPIN